MESIGGFCSVVPGGLRRRLLALSIAGACLLAIAGCGNDQLEVYHVQGKATLRDGTPLVDGLVLFESVDPKGINARGFVQKDGSWTLTTYEQDDGAIAGKHLVMLSPSVRRATGRKKYEDTIHERYLDFDSSGLEVTVSQNPEQNVFNFVLDPPAR